MAVYSLHKQNKETPGQQSLTPSSRRSIAAAMASMGPVQRYESLYMGAEEFMNQRVNEELQRAFEAGIPSSEVYPSAEISYWDSK